MDNQSLLSLTQFLEQMKGNKLRNYVIAGLDSTLIDNGKIRLFENHRNHLDSITPHSHRFNFLCLVLTGTVQNTLWKECEAFTPGSDEFILSRLNYLDEPGKHDVIAGDMPGHWISTTKTHRAGHIYGMEHNEIHSIRFSKGAKVLFFEGPNITNQSQILEPYVNGQCIPTFVTKDYMFQQG